MACGLNMQKSSARDAAPKPCSQAAQTRKAALERKPPSKRKSVKWASNLIESVCTPDECQEPAAIAAVVAHTSPSTMVEEPQRVKRKRTPMEDPDLYWQAVLFDQGDQSEKLISNDYQMYQMLRAQEATSCQDIIDSEGRSGGLIGDVVFIKSTRSPQKESGFYYNDASGFRPLTKSACCVLPTQDTLGPAAKCQVLSPQDFHDVKMIMGQVTRLHGNFTANSRNESLAIGLRATIRHMREALSGEIALPHKRRKGMATSEIEVTKKALSTLERGYHRCHFD